jgi:cell division protein FtsZ
LGVGNGTGAASASLRSPAKRSFDRRSSSLVTFTFDGKKRFANSVEGINELKDAVDAFIFVSNDKLLMVSGTQPIFEAFADSDRVLPLVKRYRFYLNAGDFQP